MGQTVNLLLFSFGGSNPPAPTNAADLCVKGLRRFIVFLILCALFSFRPIYTPKNTPFVVKVSSKKYRKQLLVSAKLTIIMGVLMKQNTQDNIYLKFHSNEGFEWNLFLLS